MQVKVKKVLFICAGNQCRSPMAEGLFKKMIEADGLTKQVYVCSAGIYASDGATPSGKAFEIMKRKNIDISKKLSKALEREAIAKSDLIITMEDEQKNYVQSSFPEFKDKVFTLKEMADEHGDIKDPMGGPLEIYEGCANEIENSLVKAKSRIFKMLKLP